mmetsp:Transcript_96014/g.266717  ORF Transcript_96014/g.266717 Transcript_96014/m.266717 type:complete len:200 (-) Transcript_96014:277-876(-)
MMQEKTRIDATRTLPQRVVFFLDAGLGLPHGPTAAWPPMLEGPGVAAAARALRRRASSSRNSVSCLLRLTSSWLSSALSRRRLSLARCRRTFSWRSRSFSRRKPARAASAAWVACKADPAPKTGHGALVPAVGNLCAEDARGSGGRPFACSLISGVPSAPRAARASRDGGGARLLPAAALRAVVPPAVVMPAAPLRWPA